MSYELELKSSWKNGRRDFNMDKDLQRKKMKGSLLGRAAGETFGRPYRGSHEPLDLLFYDPEPPAGFCHCPLDFQMMWVRLLMEVPEIPLAERDFFAQNWLDHVRNPEEEYGAALRNLRNSIIPPWSGSYDNFYSESIGGAHRAGLWGILAPGKPELAVQFAYEDSCVDHDSEGIHAALYIAALESLAFAENDLNVLLDSASNYIPENSRIAAVIKDAREYCEQEDEWEKVRRMLLKKYDCENCSDSVMTFGFLITALVLGRGDFEKTLQIALGCGRDTAATASLAGEICGLIDPDSIPEKWLTPISSKLQFSENIQGLESYSTIDEFIDQVFELSKSISIGSPVYADTLDMEQYLIPVTAGVSYRWLKWNESLSPADMDCMITKSKLPGCFNVLDAHEITPNTLYMMKFHFTIEEKKRVRIIFNCSAVSRVWVDGKFAFGRDGGWMSPSYSSVPLNQYADLELDAGIHTLVAGVAPNAADEDIFFVFGAANCSDKQWLPFAFINNTQVKE